MQELMKRVVNAKFDAGAALRGKNNPLWRVFDKAVVAEAGGLPTALQFVVPESGETVNKRLDPDWLNGISDKELVQSFLGWLDEARGLTTEKTESDELAEE